MAQPAVSVRRLHFTVPGADVALAPAATRSTREAIDFSGKLRLQAKVSQTMTGWKRWR